MNENPCLIKLGQNKQLFQTGFTLSLPDPERSREKTWT